MSANTRTEENFRLMVESVTDCAIVMLDPEGKVVTWNSGAQRILGYGGEEVAGQHAARFYAREAIERGAPLRDLEAATASGRVEDEGWRVRKDGAVFWANVVITSIRGPAGDLRGFAMLILDLTERRSVEARLTDAKHAAEQANLAQSDFLSSMSHELRTPLNAILGFAQLLESDSPPPTPSQKEGIAQILQSGTHLLELVNEVLDLASIEAGRLSWSLEALSLADVLLECRTMIEPQAQARGLRIEFPRNSERLFVWGDRIRIKQVLINLLSNAVKYNRSGGLVSVESSRPNAQRLRLSVRDTGAGLSPDKRAQLFQPFNRLGQEARPQEGTGIGLVVTKRLVELMGGSIGVESTVGEGSVFWVELAATAEPVLPPETAAVAPSEPARHRPENARRTVLYVEDNPTNLKLMVTLIARRPDLRLISATTGIGGIELARASQPDVVLMDINLPGMSGIKAMQLLHADPLTAHIPVVALSANAIPRDIERGLEAGFFRYLTKPIRLQEFMATLDVALAHAELNVARIH